MKVLFIGLLVIVAAAASVHAQEGRPFDVTIISGVSSPTGEFGDRYSTGLHLGIGTGFFLSPAIAFAPKIEFHNFAIEEEAWVETGNDAGIPAQSVDGGTRRMLLAGADLRIEPNMNGSTVQPFLLGGLGAGFLSGSDVDYRVPGDVVSKEIDSDTKLYWNVGAGVEFGRTDNFSFFVMGRFLGIPGDDETDGFDFNAVPVSIGVQF